MKKVIFFRILYSLIIEKTNKAGSVILIFLKIAGLFLKKYLWGNDANYC